MAAEADFQAFQSNMTNIVSDTVSKTAGHVQSIAMDNVDYAKRSYEEATAAFGQMAKAPSFDRALEIQRDYMKSAFEGFVQHANTVGEKQAAFAQEFGGKTWS